MESPISSYTSGGRRSNSAISPSKVNKNDLLQMTKEEIIEKMLELEHELDEFQESSKELESALEEELQELETNNNNLSDEVSKREEQIVKLNKRIADLTKELNDVEETNRTSIRNYEDKIIQLQQKLVSVEIVNDDMESNDRILTNKMQMAYQFNNELLEKLALLENDYDREKTKAIEKDLYISNYQNEVRELKSTISKLESKLSSYETDEFETSLVSMREVLNNGPPNSTSLYQIYNNNNLMRKSESLKKLHVLTTKSESMSEKMQTLKSSIYRSSPLKSPSTTSISKQLHFMEPGKNIKGLIEKESSRPGSRMSSSPSSIDIFGQLKAKSVSSLETDHLHDKRRRSGLPEKSQRPPNSS